jgi:hypothetical protein
MVPGKTNTLSTRAHIRIFLAFLVTNDMLTVERAAELMAQGDEQLEGHYLEDMAIPQLVALLDAKRNI